MVKSLSQKKRYVAGLALGLLLLGAGDSRAWWDTLLSEFRPVPLVREIEAESCSGVPADAVTQDAEANGGRGGKAVRLTPDGPGLTTELDLEPGLYALFTIARDPEGQTGVNLMALDVTEHATGQKRSWTIPVAYREAYFASGQMYFPAYAGGRYTVTSRLVSRLPQKPSDPSFPRWFDSTTLAFTNGAVRPLLADRLELRDVLANCAGVAAKTKRMLTDDSELAAHRAQFAAMTATNAGACLPFGKEWIALQGAKAPAWLAQGRPSGERQARNMDLWSLVPDFNDAIYSVNTTPWALVIGRDRPGLIVDAAEAYEKTGHAEFGWDGAVLLCALAEKYPALDYFAQAIGGAASQVCNVGMARPFMFQCPPGKNVYRGWSSDTMLKMATAYDKLFDFIQDNQALAAFVGTRIPWVKTPADVIKLLDVNLLQSGMDGCNRTYIAGDDLPSALIPLVQGVNPVSDRMLDTGLFRAMCMNLTFRGGIADQAINSYSRDGVHYIGSVGYLTKDLQNIGTVLNRYRKLGGAARFDVFDERICPQMKEADATLAQLRAGGGYRLLQGDAGDLRLQRESPFTPWPSRVLGGFGAAILESGQFGNDPLAMRGVGLTFGSGRGHAQQDTLNLEIFAHGCRVSPDLGGREEGSNRGRPNMRWNKVHNLVEVDGRNFDNPYAGSTTAGTGWNTSFSPQSGSQFMEHHARATSHTNVSLYARQTALIDTGERDSYLFDVFRVRGGKVHTYCFHGCPTERLAVNADLAPAHSAAAQDYLQQHFKDTQREGTMPVTLVADWPMEPALQQHYQGVGYESNRTVTTRLTLFGHEGDVLMVGNAWSDRYRYNFPFLYVQGQQDQEGRESVFPAIIEPFAGAPFIRTSRLLTVEPAQTGAEAAVAVEVVTTAGATDILYASGKPDQPTRSVDAIGADSMFRVSGKFAFLSRDAKGLRLAHLVGGTELAADDITITTARREYTARIGAVRYADRTVEVDAALPARLLKGAVVGFGAEGTGGLQHAFRLERLETAGKGTRLVHEKTALFYRSKVLDVDETGGTVEAEIEPSIFGADTRFCERVTVTDEGGRRHWKASLVEAERWMHVGFPGYRTSWPDRITMADVPDTNGDGRRVLRLLAATKDVTPGGGVAEGDTLQELDVTRVAEDGATFYFKMPTDEDYQRGGWQYVDRWMVNEEGSCRWRASYPGMSFRWKLDGGCRAGDFTDANGDGASRLDACVFGPGDQLRTDTFVHVRRLATPGTYAIRANVPCTLALPGDGYSAARLGADERSLATLASRREGPRIILELGESELADGEVILQLVK
jgi:hypothetical protein